MRISSLLQTKPARHVLLSLLSGVLLSLAYTVSGLWFLSFVALVPLLFVLKNTHSKRMRFLWSFIVGMLYFGSVFSFLFSSHPITWSGIDGNALSLLFISFIWIMNALLFSFFTGLWGSVPHNPSSSVSSVVTLASLWVLLEWAQAFSLSLVWWGESGLIGPHWTLGFIGYALAEFPFLLSLASLGGVYLLSFVVVFINGLIFRFVDTYSSGARTYRELTLSLFLLFLLSGGLYGVNSFARKNTETVRVASIYTTFGPQFFTTPESASLKNIQIEGLFDSILYKQEHPHIIILPENTGYLDSLSEEGRRKLVSRMSTKERVVILDSHYSFDLEKNEKIAVLEFETGDDETQHYEKQLLVPAVEYIPGVIRVPSDALLKSDWSTYFEEYLSIGKGRETTIGTHENLRMGALFCSEALTSTLYRESTRLGANILINTASHSVLNSSEHMYNQIVKFSKVRAAENNRFFIQSGNSVPSFSIDNHGRMLGETERNQHSILYTDALLLENKTIATVIGESWIILFLLFSIGGLVRVSREHTRASELK